MKPILKSTGLVILIALLVSAPVWADEAPTAASLRAAPVENRLFIDVRSDEEWAAGHLEGAVHLPVSQVTRDAPGMLPDKARPIVTYCRSGGRAATAATALRSLGYSNVQAMTGGYDELKAAGFDVVE